MRVKAALIIIAIAFVIIAVNIGSSLILTRQSLTETVGRDFSLARDIANDLVSTRIRLYKSNAQTVAERLMKTGGVDSMKDVMREQLAEFPDFMAFTVFDRHDIIAQYGDSPASINWLHTSKYIHEAFNGRTIISTTKYSDANGKLIMHICTPAGFGQVLSVTIPGMIFSELLSNYSLWDTGSIFILDEEGTVIAHFLPDLVYTRTNFINTEGASGYRDTKDFFIEMLVKEEGRGIYTHDRVEYQCAYARVLASELGWRIGLSAPLSESPLSRVRFRLVVLELIFFASSVIAAVVCSGQLAKPYYKIAEQKRLLEELHETALLQKDRIQEIHQRTQLMTDAMPICSMLWDKSGAIFDCNEEAVKAFEMKNKQDFITRFDELSPEYQDNGSLSSELSAFYLNKAFEDGRIRFDWMHRLPDGTPFPCEMTLVRVNYDGIDIIAAYARDLREQKQMMAETLRLQAELKNALQEAREANNAKSSFLANMSHEMRTPLNAVIGLSELMLNTGDIQGEAEDRLGKIYGSGMTLLGIVNDILDISKIESGKFDLHPVEYNTPSLVNDIISLNIMRIGEKPIQFVLKIDESFPGNLLGDDLRVKQVFNNLLSNAFKYTDAGTVEWTMSFEREGGDIWLISNVSDTGMGIKQEDIPLLFLDYSRLDAQTNRKTEGTGLGLPITKRLVGMMDGTIDVSSEYGKGSVFSVRLRQKFVSDIPIGKEVARNLGSARYTDDKRSQARNFKRIDLSYARVLVVDDMPTNLDVAKGMMMPYGMQVDCAASGKQAVAMIREENPRYNAVFMDHMMPGMDGIEAVRIIREEIGTDYAKNVPVIALTANAIVGNEEKFLGQGFQAFISKPIDMLRLDAILRQWVRNKDLEKEPGSEPADLHMARVANDASRDSPLGGITIEGLDIAAGLNRLGWNEDVYTMIIQSYATNTRPLLGDMEKLLASGNLTDYGIVVHGIKGSSYSIGASRAGTEAERLELLAKAGETAQVRAGNSPFIAYMQGFLDSIEAALAKLGRTSAKPTAAAPDPAVLRELREACGEYNVDRVDKAMLALESFEYENGTELVAWLREQADNMSYEEIAGGNWPEIVINTGE